MPYVELSGVHPWFEDTGGNGTPIIFLHAATGTCESWVYQLPHSLQQVFAASPMTGVIGNNHGSPPPGSSLASRATTSMDYQTTWAWTVSIWWRPPLAVP